MSKYQEQDHELKLIALRVSKNRLDNSLKNTEYKCTKGMANFYQS